MISALADAGAALDEPLYRDAAVECADFLVTRMRDDEGRLLRTYNRGEARLRAVLEDHAFLLEALITLYEATFDPRWFAEARALADTILERFADPENGGFFSTADDHDAADRAPQGHRRQPDPGRPVGRLPRPAAARRAHRRAPLRGGRARRHPAPAHDRAAAPGRLRPPAAGDRLPRLPRARGRPRRAGPRAARARRALDLPPARRARRRRARRRPAAGRARARGRPRRRLRVRALRLPAARSRNRPSWPRCWTEKIQTEPRFRTVGDDGPVPHLPRRQAREVRGGGGLLPDHGGRRRALLRQVRGRAGERDRLLPPRQGRVGQVARGRQALPGRRAGARGDRVRAHGRADRRRPPPGRRGPALVPVRPAVDRPAAAAADLLRQRRRRAVLDPDPRDGGLRALRGGDGRDPRPRERRARRADGEGDRRGRLRRRRDQGVREHQRHPARGHGAGRPDPADRHLPVADLLGDPVLHGAAGRVVRARVRLPDRRGGGDDQRAVRRHPAGARVRRGHGLRAACS